MNASVLAWLGIGIAFLQFVLYVVSPSTTTPWNWSATSRTWIALGVSTVLGVAQALQGGTPIQTAVLTALGTLIASLVGHFGPQAGSGGGSVAKARGFVRLPLMFGISAAALACVVVVAACLPPATQNTIKEVLTDGQKLCIAENAIFPNDEIKALCNLPQDIEDIVAIIEQLTSKTRTALASAKKSAGTCK